MKIFIKYMVSIRCKMVVTAELDRLGITHGTVELGQVELKKPLSDEQRSDLKKVLLRSGLELMEDKKAILIDRIKKIVVEMVHYEDEVPRVKHSIFISEKLGHNYTYLSNLFSEVTGITIEQYIIMHKIEKVKELILYDELNLTQISYKLDYSSVAHLSNQFKKVTGLSPSYFKKLKKSRAQSIENM